MPDKSSYQLTRQVGYILRRANQRHLTIFADLIPTLTPTQFAALAKLCELGSVSQNELGRQTAMDAATIKGVIDRLKKRQLVTTRRDTDDQRRLFIEASQQGAELYNNTLAAARKISERTLQTLNQAERKTLLELLTKIT
ncbi:MAG: MarR family transcriptional regulator [Rhizobiaceae bacterium]|nr:MarR family transcriptional regulator [Rhizobiaceae bacterium]